MRAWIAALLALAGPAFADCGEVPGPCEVDGGSYHLMLPEGVEGPVPAFLWLHGAGGSGEGIVRNSGMASQFLDRGWAVIGANGLPRPGGSGGGSWNFYDRPERRDELAFLTAIADDAALRHGIARDRIMLGGFSIGGSMTSYIACRAPERFWAYAPLAGGFWRPHPEDCAGPVRLFHTHGWIDQTVPLEGRPLRGGEFYQGDIFETLAQWREENGCDALRPDAFVTEGPFLRRRWTDCDDGTALEFALHPGGHMIPYGWSAMMLDWAETLPPP